MSKNKAANTEPAKHADIDKIKKDVQVLSADAQELKKDTVEYLRHKADEGKAEAKIKTAEMKSAISSQMDEITGATQDKIIEVENTVRKKPLQSIFAAFLAGAAISYLMKR